MKYIILFFVGLFSSVGFSQGVFGTPPMSAPSYAIGTTIASSATISPDTQMTTVSGTAAISTITPPPSFSSSVGSCLDFLASGAWSTTSGGNIATIMTAISGNAYKVCWFGTQWTITQGPTGATGPSGVIPVYGPSGVISSGFKCWSGTATSASNGTWSASLSTAGFTATPMIQLQALSTGGTASTLVNASYTSASSTAVSGYVSSGTTLSILGATIVLFNTPTTVNIWACGT